MATLKPLWLSLSELSARLDRSPALLLACDFDGTLAPIVEHPNVARIPSRAREALERLSSRNDTQLAFVSGRRLEDLDRQLGLRSVFLSGASGLETQNESGNRERHLAPEQALPADLRQSLQSWCERFPGSWVEDKEVSIALHYRQVQEDLQPAFGAGVRRRVRPFKSKAELIHGKRVFEIVPGGAWDKAAAIRQWLDRHPTDCTLFFFGDDTNDEPVHELVRQRGGIAVAVGRIVSRAEYVLPSPQEVTWFMEWLDREWSTRPINVHAEEGGVMQSA